MEGLVYESLSREVLGAGFAVHSALGPGLLESAYEGAMCVELRCRGLQVERQKAFPLFYRGERVGDYFADVLVEERIILELKAVKMLLPEMEAQIINYLKVSGLPVGYLVNFRGTSLMWKRFVSVPAVMHGHGVTSAETRE